MLGRRPIAEVIEHATAFVTALQDVTGTVVDLGAGGGVPGLVIATARPDLRLVLVERRATRTDHLRRLLGRLDLTTQVAVIMADARHLELAVRADAVVARGFGNPVTTLRAATPLCRRGGRIVVSEPPGGRQWPAGLLTACGVQPVGSADGRVAIFETTGVPRGTRHP
ncbi:MAG: class I SAM-dependent methyltransferase [Acidimicrobiia bacterium]|nr:class I SAM-dependent methyltransferase [Acidimicrobiia bacterium]